MLRLRSWAKHQSGIIGKATWTRKDRVKKGEAPPESLTNPLSIQSINVACVLDHDFATFAELVGGPVAETYFLRVLQYVANGHALDGVIPVEPDKFAAIVLSRTWHIVPKKVGVEVYAALVAANLALIHEWPTRRSSGDPSRARSAPSTSNRVSGSDPPTGGTAPASAGAASAVPLDEPTSPGRLAFREVLAQLTAKPRRKETA